MAVRRSTPARRPVPVRRLRIRRALVRRWLVLTALCVVGLLYVKPLRSYLETREAVAERSDEVLSLSRQRGSLEKTLAARSSRATLVREARRLGYVGPGERLVIVRGVDVWRARSKLKR